jgi:hypothetical protein
VRQQFDEQLLHIISVELTAFIRCAAAIPARFDYPPTTRNGWGVPCIRFLYSTP